MNSDESSSERSKVSLSQAVKAQTSSQIKEELASSPIDSTTSSDGVDGQKKPASTTTPPTESTTATESSRTLDEPVVDTLSRAPEHSIEPAVSRPATRKSQSTSKPSVASRGPGRTKKSQNAPKRFRSSYIFSAQEKFQEIRADLESQGLQPKAPESAKLVSAAWKQAGPSERRKFEVMSEEDKARFEVEKRMYDGPWRAPIGGKRARGAGEPKRPMSAFLAFSNIRRSAVKARMPYASNGEVSKELSRMWKEAPDDVKNNYKAVEREELAEYKAEMTSWQQEKQQVRDDRERVAHNIATLQGANVADSTALPEPDEPGSSPETKPPAKGPPNEDDGQTSRSEPSGPSEASVDPSKGGFGVGDSPFPLRHATDVTSSVAFSSSDEELAGYYASSSNGGSTNGSLEGNSASLPSNTSEPFQPSQKQNPDQGLELPSGPSTSKPERQSPSSYDGQDQDDSPGTIEGYDNLSQHIDSVSPNTTLSFPSTPSDGA